MAGITMNVTGLDTETIIKELMAVERRPLVFLENKQTTIATKKQAWSEIGSKLNTLSSKIAALTSFSNMNKMSATIKDESVLNVTVGGSAKQGSYSVEVMNLASAQVLGSKTFSSAETVLGLSGTVKVNGKSIDITNTDSLYSIADKINSISDSGVSASVLKVSPTEVQLVLSSKKTGIENQIVIEGEYSVWNFLGVVTDLGTSNEIRAATDAVFSINGVQFTRPSNTVSDAIEGVTLELMQAQNQATGLGGSTSFEVGFDDDSAVSLMKEFVDEYNGFLDLIKKYSKWDVDSRSGGLLFGDSLLRRIMSELRQVIFHEVSGALPGFRFVGQVGLSTGTNYSPEGKLSLDEETFRKALKDNREAVYTMFGVHQINAALSSNGGAVSASSEHSQHAASNVIDGISSSIWMDNTPGEFPDILEVTFDSQKTIDRIVLSTVDTVDFPASLYGISDFRVEYWDQTSQSWITLDSVTDYSASVFSARFHPVKTDKVRVVVEGSNDGQYSRIVEFGAYQENDGVFAKLLDTVQKYTGVEGYLPLRQKQLDAQNKLIERQISDKQRVLDMRLDALKRQFSALETLLQKMNVQGAWISQQIASLSSARS
jgi:flagellar hook-associated protein 2